MPADHTFTAAGRYVMYRLENNSVAYFFAEAYGNLLSSAEDEARLVALLLNAVKGKERQILDGTVKVGLMFPAVAITVRDDSEGQD